MTTLNINMDKANSMFTSALSDLSIDVNSNVNDVEKSKAFMESYYGSSVGASVINSTPVNVYVD